MPQRLNAGALVAAIGGLLLFVSLFLDWFGAELTAWTVFELVDLLLAVLAIAAVALVVSEVTGFAPAPTGDDRRLAALGLTALVLVALALVNDPPSVFRQAETQTGAWLGLVGAVLMAAGGLLAAARISLVITFGPRERVTRPGYEEPEPDDPYEQEAEAAPGETAMLDTQPHDVETETRPLRSDEPR